MQTHLPEGKYRAFVPALSDLFASAEKVNARHHVQGYNTLQLRLSSSGFPPAC